MSPQRSVPRDSEPRPSSRPVLPPCHLVYEFDTKFQLVVKPRTSLDNSHSYCIIIQLLLSHGGTRRHGTCWTSWGQLLPSCTQYKTRLKCCGTHFVTLLHLLNKYVCCGRILFRLGTKIYEVCLRYPIPILLYVHRYVIISITLHWQSCMKWYGQDR